ncbi:MarR family winged helix-turn-helix transcriptional regulator [Micromonospora sp. BQ11]|uniref:MarR family winged helix-turn-helix transcriptional regulator n=1 Tax=Micromonospora sp. BQ11 TaxID=3452212 RepID=UPI003F893A30
MEQPDVTTGTGRTRPEVTGALAAMRELHSATEVLLDAVAARYRINRNDLHCLEILQREGEMNARRLAELSQLSPAAITKITDRLVAAGYVTREPSRDDRRAHLIRISAQHGELREAVWRPVVEAASALLGTLPSTEVRRMTTIVRDLSQVSREHARNLRREGPSVPDRSRAGTGSRADDQRR